MNKNASHFLEHFVVEDRLLEAATNICDYINNHGRFMVMLWVKRGEVLDQGVDQPNNGLPYNAEHTTVQSGNLNHHIVRFMPMEPENINIDELNDLRFNVVSGFNL